MANNSNTDSRLVWVKAMERGQCFPLDATEIWYSLDEAIEYAKNDPTAYIGQTIKVIDQVNQTVVSYMIKNEAGDLIEVGAGSSIDTQNILHGVYQKNLANILEDYVLNIDYAECLAFDTDEIVVDFTKTSSILGVAVLGQMILGNR